MSKVMLNIVDSQRAIHAEVEGGVADAVVGALAADPETIEELQAALGRFIKPTPERGFFDNWSAGTRDQANDLGVFIIELTARMVVGRSAHWLLEPTGRAAYHDGTAATKVWISYQVSQDWLFSEETDGWRGVAEQRRRDAPPRCDARQALYEEVLKFVASECLAAARRGEEDEPVVEIHARWMMTPRSDLLDASPRDVLLARRESIDSDLESRAGQWSRLGECPPGLNPESSAFRFGGFGTHENVVYYEFVRHLIEACWERLGKQPDVEEAEEIKRLKKIKTRWLRKRQRDNLEGFSPNQVIERERARFPLAVSGEHAMADDDCPLCQLMTDQSGPVFWHLDGCNMDEDFAFSFHSTRGEWEQEQRYWEEMAESWKAERTERAAREASGREAAPPSLDAADQPAPVWSRSGSNLNAIEGLPEGQAREVMLFGIGACLAELGLELKDSAETNEFVGMLNRDFGNLRDAVRDLSGCLITPVVHRFCDELASVADARPDLAGQCGDLERQLNDLAARMGD